MGFPPTRGYKANGMKPGEWADLWAKAQMIGGAIGLVLALLVWLVK